MIRQFQIFSLLILLIFSSSYANTHKTEEKKKEEVMETTPDVLDAADFATSFNTSGSNEAALVAFAVTGLIVAVAWVPYFPLLAYRAMTEKEDKMKFDQLVSINWNPLFEKEGSLNSARYSLYLDEQNPDDIADLGFSVESGYYLTKQTGRKEGGYWLIGPSMLLGTMKKSGPFGRLDLMGGSSFDSEVGLVSKAELSGNWAFSSGFTMGVSLGGLYFDIKENRGIVSSGDDLSFILGANAGFAF